jgi:hypothetical protein
VVDTIASGAPEAKKAVLQALVAETRVESRKRVRPLSRVPIDGATGEAPDQQKKVAHRQGQCPRQDSNLRTALRRRVLYPLSYEGGNVADVRSAAARRFYQRVLSG